MALYQLLRLSLIGHKDLRGFPLCLSFGLVVAYLGNRVRNIGKVHLLGLLVCMTSVLVHSRLALDRTSGSEYFGIPYAEPAVGQTCWAATRFLIGTGDTNSTSYVINSWR